MLNFGEWVKMTRGAKSQASCAMRAGMTPQQWNQIERLVKRPNTETVKRVALGLDVSDDVALLAAGYDASAGDPAIRLAKEIEQYLLQAAPSRRPAIEAAVVQVVRAMVAA